MARFVFPAGFGGCSDDRIRRYRRPRWHTRGARRDPRSRRSRKRTHIEHNSATTIPGGRGRVSLRRLTVHSRRAPTAVPFSVLSQLPSLIVPVRRLSVGTRGILARADLGGCALVRPPVRFGGQHCFARLAIAASSNTSASRRTSRSARPVARRVERLLERRPKSCPRRVSRRRMAMASGSRRTSWPPGTSRARADDDAGGYVAAANPTPARHRRPYWIVSRRYDFGVRRTEPDQARRGIGQPA